MLKPPRNQNKRSREGSINTKNLLAKKFISSRLDRGETTSNLPPSEPDQKRQFAAQSDQFSDFQKLAYEDQKERTAGVEASRIIRDTLIWREEEIFESTFIDEFQKKINPDILAILDSQRVNYEEEKQIGLFLRELRLEGKAGVVILHQSTLKYDGRVYDVQVDESAGKVTFRMKNEALELYFKREMDYYEFLGLVDLKKLRAQRSEEALAGEIGRLVERIELDPSNLIVFRGLEDGEEGG